ncbi:MAG: HK97 family phage prohead protease [Devosia sp.]
MRIEGYVARYNEETVIWGEFRERLAPGAFRRTLRESPDVVMLLDHDSGRVIGRTSSGSLTLEEDSIGLRFSLLPDEKTPEGQTAIGTVRRGDVRGCSFGFQVKAEEWESGGSKLPLRTLTDVSLYECTLTGFPAYPTTSAKLIRSATGTAAPSANPSVERAKAAMRFRGIAV